MATVNGKTVYTFEELSSMADADLYRIGHTEAGIMRSDVYGSTRSELIGKILMACGAEGELAKAALGSAADPKTPEAPSAPVIPMNSAASNSIPAQTDPTEEAKPRRRGPRILKAAATTSPKEEATTTSGGTIAAPQVTQVATDAGNLGEQLLSIIKAVASGAKATTDPAVIEAISKTTKELTDLSAQVAQLSEAASILATVMASATGIEDLAGTSPLELAEDLAKKYHSAQ